MPRDGKNKTPTPKTALERKSIELTDHLLQKLCNEKVFPKRSRWLMAGKIADLANDYMNCVDRANEIRVVTRKERDERHYWQTMALANLMTLDARINQAGRVLGIPPDTMEFYAGLVNDCRNLILAWMSADEKKYGAPSKIADDAQAQAISAILADFEQFFLAWAKTSIQSYDSLARLNHGEGDSHV